MDAFYASVEQRDNPELQNKALALVADLSAGLSLRRVTKRENLGYEAQCQARLRGDCVPT